MTDANQTPEASETTVQSAVAQKTGEVTTTTEVAPVASAAPAEPDPDEFNEEFDPEDFEDYEDSPSRYPPALRPSAAYPDPHPRTVQADD